MLTVPSVSSVRRARWVLSIETRKKRKRGLAVHLVLLPLLTWYRNNVLHLFALPALIALLISRSTRTMTEKQLIEQVALIYPYVAQELTAAENPDTLAALAALEAQGLIVRVKQNLLPPDRPSEAYEQLTQLATRFWKCCNACTWLSALHHSVLSKQTS